MSRRGRRYRLKTSYKQDDGNFGFSGRATIELAIPVLQIMTSTFAKLIIQLKKIHGHTPHVDEWGNKRRMAN
jgi:hypothetical protein